MRSIYARTLGLVGAGFLLFSLASPSFAIGNGGGVGTGSGGPTGTQSGSPSGSETAGVPEISPQTLTGGLALLVTGTLLLADRRKKA